MDQRTREQLPLLPVLVRTANQRDAPRNESCRPLTKPHLAR